MRWRRWLGVAFLAPLPLPAATAKAASGAGSPAALVIGEAAYTAAPPLQSCTLSAHAVAAALRRDGLAVDLLLDASDGAISAALTTPVAVLYLCGYASSDAGRTFLLPVEASLARPGDAVTEGLLARSLLEFPVRAGAPASLVVLDTTAWPKPVPPPDWPALRATAMPAGHAAAAATGSGPTTGPTPLATALVEALAAPAPDAARIAQALPATLVLTGPGPAPLNPPPPAARPPAAVPAGAPAANPAPAPAPAPAPVPPPPPASTPTIPDEPATTAAQRTAVQTALAALGYYDGAIDGVYGPDTRAAMRRYQHELGQAMTGRLTSAEATRLVGNPHR